MYKKSVILLLIAFLLTLTLASAQENTPYHLKLLAVQEGNGEFQGSDADLYLELKQGSGRVFLETFPLTKMDTQISTRFAKEIACNQFKLNCDRYDFIFTIKAKSNIIGGPSAGAAISALTTIAVLDLPYDEDVTITGTINSGGIVGPVGGVKEKLEAAAKTNLKKVMIAKGTSIKTLINDSDRQMDLIEYSKENLSLEVVETISLDQVVYHLTGTDLNSKEVNVTENKEYTNIMQGLQQTLCARTEKLEDNFAQEELVVSEEVAKIVQEKKEKADNATAQGDYYSAASFCFTANIDLKEDYYQQKEVTLGRIARAFEMLERDVLTLEKQVNEEKIETISDLQTLMVVKERINDAKQQVKKFQENKNESSLAELRDLIAYAEERFFSAHTWKQFFAMEGKKFVFDQEMIRNSCLQKISEAEERVQYVSFFLGSLGTKSIDEKTSRAKTASEMEDPLLCLITASQAKADANGIMSSFGLDNETVNDYLESKQKAVERVIMENSAEDIFPILGYSYYQYALSLQESEPYTALLYLEYALEMSELNIYFPEEQTLLEKIEKEIFLGDDWLVWLKGFFSGAVIAGLIFLVWRKLGKK